MDSLQFNRLATFIVTCVLLTGGLIFSFSEGMSSWAFVYSSAVSIVSITPGVHILFRLVCSTSKTMSANRWRGGQTPAGLNSNVSKLQPYQWLLLVITGMTLLMIGFIIKDEISYPGSQKVYRISMDAFGAGSAVWYLVRKITAVPNQEIHGPGDDGDPL